ncbi:MAG: hypothetical protein GY762_09250 [Proteobacteria bacterium]|nr:hypothetical protein [Pseudomonadota bacterium]
MTGWTGNILHIDLTEERITHLPTKEYARRFLGGLGIGEKLYWDESSPGLDALHPDSPLIFMTGPLTASGAPAASRLVVCGKSPVLYPETFASGNMGGFFPTQLKKAGFDGIVVRGKAAKPSYLHIENGEVALRDASPLWGLGNRATRQAIQDAAGLKASILSIGPGGENATRIGVIFSDLASTAALGFGSVMGSKNLKAIVAVGTQSIPVADPARVKNIRKKIKAMRGDGFFNLFGKPSTFPGTEIVKKTPCAGCPQGCWRTLQKIESGESEVRKCQVGMFYVLWDMRYHGKPTDTSFKSAIVANDYGLCVHELIFGLMWFEACIDKGILTDKEVGLPVSELGSFEFIEKLIKMICSGEGVGKALAEGVLRASKFYGAQSEQFMRDNFTQTGRGIAYGPKVFLQSALIYALEPRPLIAELHGVTEPLVKWFLWYSSNGEKSYVSLEVLRKIAERFWGSADAVDFSSGDGMAMASLKIQNRQLVKESLILCDFIWPIYDDASTSDHVGDPTLEAQLFTAVTGEELTERGLEPYGERIAALHRAILLRDGRQGRVDDVLPDFFFVEKEERIPDVFGIYNPELMLPGAGDQVLSRKGKALDRGIFEELKNDYYALRGWDRETGFIKKETLKELGLEELIEALKEKAV